MSLGVRPGIGGAMSANPRASAARPSCPQKRHPAPTKPAPRKPALAAPAATPEAEVGDDSLGGAADGGAAVPEGLARGSVHLARRVEQHQHRRHVEGGQPPGSMDGSTRSNDRGSEGRAARRRSSTARRVTGCGGLRGRSAVCARCFVPGSLASSRGLAEQRRSTAGEARGVQLEARAYSWEGGASRA